jgi:hypothetical protein
VDDFKGTRTFRYPRPLSVLPQTLDVEHVPLRRIALTLLPRIDRGRKVQRRWVLTCVAMS